MDEPPDRLVTFWIDAQLSPKLATYLTDAFGVDAKVLRDLGLRDAVDTEIYFAARSAQAVVVTKDADFAALLQRLGPPPQILWLTCGNTSNYALWAVFARNFDKCRALLQSGESLVEIR